VFLLNNDAVAHSCALTELVRVAEVHPEVGIVGAKIYHQDKPRTIWYAGARRRWGVLAAAGTSNGQLDRGQFDILHEVDYVFGAAMLVRRTVFETIGLLDEGFFLYLEDMDFCLRAQRAGYSLVFAPLAHVWHIGSASTIGNSGMRKYHLARSTVRFVRKHTSLAVMPLALGFWMLVLLRFVATDLVCGNLADIRSCWLGLVSGRAEARRA